MFPIDQAVRDRWMQLMSKALANAVLRPAAEHVLQEFLEATATSLINRVRAREL